MDRFASSLLLVILLSWTACSNEDGSPRTDPEPPDVVEDATPTGDASPTGDAEVTEPGFDPWGAVPPVKREADPATACPAAFVDGPLGSGQYEGYEVSWDATDESGEVVTQVEIRSFLLGVPDPDFHGGPRPLMILFNGTNGSGQKAYDSYNGVDWLNAGFIVLAPDSAGHGYLWPSWDGMLKVNAEDAPNPDLALFDSLLGCATGHLEVDANRIYVAGHSAGGIMSNFIIQRRSDILAGGIVASGIFDLTGPNPDISMDPLVVMVTWGGDNDAYSGDSENENVAVPTVNFVEQASIASIHYEETEGVHQIHCRGDDLEHAYLDGAFDLMHDFFIHHPKGLATHGDWSLADAPGTTESECSEDAYVYVPPVVVECEESEPTGCYAFCQLVADCVVENSTVAPILAPALEAMGYSGENLADCGGCLAQCAQDAAAGGEVDVPVLACFEEHAATAECGAGIPGSLPAIDAINECCIEAPESQLCTRACEAALLVSVAKPFFEEGCAEWITDCVADSETCAEDSECCSGICEGNDGEDGTCEPPPPPCLWDDGACTDDVECCSGQCEAGGCVPLPPPCSALDEPCAADLPCCFGECGDNGLCNEPATGSCDNEGDLTVVATKDVEAIAAEGALACLGDPDVEACLVAILTGEDVGLSPECSGCYGGLVACGIENCVLECVDPDPSAGPLGDACTCCRDEYGCTDIFYACSALPDDNPEPNCEPPPCQPDGQPCEDNAGCCSGDCGADGICKGPAPAGSCDNGGDLAVLATKDVEAIAAEGALACLGDPDVEACLVAILTADDIGLSPECSGCYGGLLACSIENCVLECVDPDPNAGPLGDACTCCRDEYGCTDAFYACSALPDDNPEPNCGPNQ